LRKVRDDERGGVLKRTSMSCTKSPVAESTNREIKFVFGGIIMKRVTHKATARFNSEAFRRRNWYGELWQSVFPGLLAVMLFSVCSCAGIADSGKDSTSDSSDSPGTAVTVTSERKDICRYCHPPKSEYKSTGESFWDHPVRVATVGMSAAAAVAKKECLFYRTEKKGKAKCNSCHVPVCL